MVTRVIRRDRKANERKLIERQIPLSAAECQTSYDEREQEAQQLHTPNVKLAPSGRKLSSTKMRDFINMLGISLSAYQRWSGGQTFEEFIAANSHWSLRDWQVLVLENRDNIVGQRRPGARPTSKTAPGTPGGTRTHAPGSGGRRSIL